jgi:hypothetical protein
MARSTKRKRGRSRRPAGDPRVARVAAPKTRLRSLFALLDDVITKADAALLTTETPTQPLVRFDVAMLQRGINTLKAARLLTEHGHWEFGATVARQLYELLVNMEYLAAQPNRNEAAFRYAKFGLLQSVRAQQRQLSYDQRTGRPVDAQRVDSIEALLERAFPEFRDERPNGDVRWPRSWSGKGTRQLAMLSPNRMRVAQYDQLFTIWSEQTHASPGALIDSFARRDGVNWVDEIVARDDVRTAEIVTMAISLFLELWHTLPNAPTFDPETFLKWTGDLMAEARKHGAQAPPPLTPASTE